MPTIKRRRRKQTNGLSAAIQWALVYGNDIGMPCGLPWPFASEAEARASWRRHRDVLMAQRLPGHVPSGLWIYEPESFASLEAIRALRLDRASLHHGAGEFESYASFHRRHGRDELAAEFEQRAARVRQVIAEGAA